MIIGAANQYYLRTMKRGRCMAVYPSVNASKVKVAVIDGGADLNSARPSGKVPVCRRNFE